MHQNNTVTLVMETSSLQGLKWNMVEESGCGY